MFFVFCFHKVKHDGISAQGKKFHIANFIMLIYNGLQKMKNVVTPKMFHMTLFWP